MIKTEGLRRSSSANNRKPNLTCSICRSDLVCDCFLNSLNSSCKKKKSYAWYFCTTIPIMHTLHVKIDNQAFLLIHVVEQVQPFKRGQLILIASASESEIVRGEKVVPMRPTILTRLVNSEVPSIEKNVRNSRLEAMEKSGVLCRYVPSAPVCYFSPHSVFWWMHMQSFETDYTQQNGEHTCREM